MLGNLRLPQPQPATDVVHRSRSRAKQLDDSKSIRFAKRGKRRLWVHDLYIKNIDEYIGDGNTSARSSPPTAQRWNRNASTCVNRAMGYALNPYTAQRANNRGGNQNGGCEPGQPHTIGRRDIDVMRNHHDP